MTIVGKSIYPLKIIMRVFKHFATSRTIYGKLTKDYQLASICTLTRITSKFASQDDLLFLEKLMLKINICQRRPIIVIGKVFKVFCLESMLIILKN